ncbi:carboxymethylenebutenolidase [Paucibacter oligotrophus]|uniref:Carboxymethylenebutenolidase n=1 Tax=Roseateles oligotrophus TaxID=1769250 RepID=A0A840LBD2_9BURK|nr:dienelactone hydrolase family protein [Roseateles oligotrophus]MBB4845480.1 carboxymethylenebutenolidase [Roseateles oligotrophus]
MSQTTSAASLGYAAAAQASLAQAIHTPATGLQAGPFSLDVAGFALSGYSARPLAVDKPPVILLISEIFGVHEHIADVARRLAQQGYWALAPALFLRQGDAGAYRDIPTLMQDVVYKVPDAQVMADLDAVLAWAQAQGGDVGRLGVTGFCWGGRISWLYAAHNPAVRAAVAWYGRVIGVCSERTPAHPIDRVGQLHGPVLGLYGGCDEGIALDTVDKMKLALKKGSVAAQRSEIHVYPQAPHAFFADYRPSYRQDEAVDGWQRCLAWFAVHGVV